MSINPRVLEVSCDSRCSFKALILKTLLECNENTKMHSFLGQAVAYRVTQKHVFRVIFSRQGNNLETELNAQKVSADPSSVHSPEAGSQSPERSHDGARSG